MKIQQSISNICILISPVSQTRKAKRVLNEVTSSLTLLKMPFTHHTFNWPDNLSSFSDLWIIGGDGTLNYALNKYKTINLPVVIFKGGTGNDFAWKLYGDANVSQQIEAGLTCMPQFVDVAQCNEQLYINSAGFGFDGEVLKSMKSIRSIGGHLGYLGAALKTIFTYGEVGYQIRAKKYYDNKYLLVAINNSSRTGGGFHITPGASINDGFLDMVLCEKLSVFNRLRYLPVIEKGKHLNLQFISHEQGTEFTVTAGRRILGQLDGELISGDSFKIKVLPAYIQFRY